MNFTNNMIGLTKVATTTILMSLFFLSCSKNIDNYSVTITNNYFETLYNLKIGSIQFDTLLVNKTTPVRIIEQGNCEFSAESESGLIFKTNLVIAGLNENVNLALDIDGKLTK